MIHLRNIVVLIILSSIFSSILPLIVSNNPLEEGSHQKFSCQSLSSDNLNFIFNESISLYNRPLQDSLASFTQNEEHSPILISGDDDFKVQAAYENWTGNGNATNPFIIENYIINASEVLIDIRHTSCYFEIKNNYLSGINRLSPGIHLDDVSHGSISNNFIFECQDGIQLDNSSKVILHENLINRNLGAGIWLNDESHNNIILGNFVFNNGWNGIEIGSATCYSNVIISNTCYNNSYCGIWTCSISDSIVTKNNVYNNRFGIFLLASSGNNTLISNQIHKNTADGLSLWASEDNYLVNNTLENNTLFGISLISSVENHLINNKITRNGRDGINLQDSERNIISSNVISTSGNIAVNLIRSGNNTLLDNILKNKGIKITGSKLEDYSQFEVKNNTVDGLLILYWFEKLGESVPSGVSQVFLVKCDSIEIIDLHLSGLQGAYCSNLIIHNNTFSNSSWNGIYLDSSKDSIISANRIVGSQGMGISLQNSRNCYIARNIITNNTENGLNFGDTNECSIYGNIVANNSENGMEIWNFERFFISYNIISFNNGKGIKINFSNNSKLICNTVIKNNDGGIHLRVIANSSIIDNVINSNQGAGFIIQGATDNIITLNEIYGNTKEGTCLEETHNNFFSKNTISENDLGGIDLYKSNNNSFSMNLIHNNKLFGLKCWISDNNSLSNNTFSNNTDYGIWIETSNHIEVFWNSFYFNNMKSKDNRSIIQCQAFDNGRSNLFTNNYWNDWIEPDDDENGYVDIPYCIDGNAQNEDQNPRVSYYSDVSEISTFPLIISRISIFILVISIIMYPIMRRKFKKS
jgi:parallel beta-helix repeat protein